MSDLQWIGQVKDKVEQEKSNQKEVDISLDSMSQKSMSIENYVTTLPRLHTCLKALASFFELIYSPIIVVISAICILRIYGFVDASGSGFGSSLLKYYKLD